VWGRLTQPLATHLPWMVAVGNHELIDLLLPFLNRFSMPGMLPANGPPHLHTAATSD
jgi:hypothetical protein